VHLEDAVRHQVEVPATLAPVDRALLLPFDDRQADRAAVFVIHSGVHGERDAPGSLSEARFQLGKAADGGLARAGSDQLDTPLSGAADGDAALLEHLRLAGR
jgi:hypothetical protein